MSGVCAAAALLGLMAFLLSGWALYQSVVAAHDMERWRALQDHPSTRARQVPPEDRDDWPGR